MPLMDRDHVIGTRQRAAAAESKPADARSADDKMAMEAGHQLEQGIVFGTAANPDDPPRWNV